MSRLSVRPIATALCLSAGLFVSARAQVDTSDFSLPSDAVSVNVTSSTYGADPTGRTDATDAINKAITAVKDAWGVVYLPAGTYLVSNSLGGNDGTLNDFLTLQGAGPTKTTIKLRDNCAGFQDSLHSKPVAWLLVGGNVSMATSFRNLTINTGTANPGADGIEYNSNNGGMIDNVQIISGDGRGVAGVSMKVFGSPGPTLITNVRVNGFQYGIYSGGGTVCMYSVTMANILLENQRVYGMYTSAPVQVMNLTSHNSVRAVRNQCSAMILINAAVTGGAASAYGVTSDSPIYVRNLTTSGYGTALVADNAVHPGPAIGEFISRGLQVAPKSPAQGLKLPFPSPPRVAWIGDKAQWANVTAYASIQAAFNSGKPVIYFPNTLRKTWNAGGITVPSTVKIILGLMTKLGGTLSFSDPDSTKTVLIDQLGDMTLQQTGKNKIYVKDALGFSVSTLPGTGDLWVDNSCCNNISLDHTNLWIRQVDIETGIAPYIGNNGGRLVVLGYKTEKPATVLQNTNGAQSEILGGFIYPVSGVAAGTPMYINDNSALFLFHNKMGEYPIFVREIRNGTTIDTAKPAAVAIYVSNPDSIGYVGVGQPSLRSGSLHAGMEVRGFPSRSGVLLCVNFASPATYSVRVFSTDGRIVFCGAGRGSRQFRVPARGLGASKVHFAVVDAGEVGTARLTIVN